MNAPVNKQRSGLASVLAGKTGGLAAELDNLEQDPLPGTRRNMTGPGQLAAFKIEQESAQRQIAALEQEKAAQSARIAQLEADLRQAQESGDAAAQAELAARLEQETTALAQIVEQQKSELEQLAGLLEQARSAALVVLPFDKIIMVAGRRRHKTEEEYAEMKANIKAHGISSAPVVIPLGDGRYELVAGYNRVAILQDLGHTETQFQVSQQDPRKAKELAFFDNMIVNELAPFEKYLRLTEIQRDHHPELNQYKALAEYVGMELQRVSDLMVYRKLPPKVIDLLTQCYHALRLEAALDLEKLCRAGRTEQVINAVRAAVESKGKMKQNEIVRRAAGVGDEPSDTSEPEWITVGTRRVLSLRVRTNAFSIKLGKNLDKADFERVLREALQNYANKLQT